MGLEKGRKKVGVVNGRETGLVNWRELVVLCISL